MNITVIIIFLVSIILLLIYYLLYYLLSPSCPHIPTLVNCTNNNYPVLGGTDLVNLYNFNDHALTGDSKYKLIYLGYTYLFSNNYNKQLFKHDPDKYIPQNGGFCSWAIATEYKPSFVWGKKCLGPAVSLNSKFIYNDKLYLFLADKPYEKFKKNIEENIKKADDRYLKWYSKPGQIMNTTCVFDDYNKLIIKV